MTPADEARARLAEEEVRRLAYVDSVTGLGNRVAMLQEIDELGAPPREGRAFAAFLTASVDELSTVNDAFGFEAGDRLLLESSKRLRQLEGDGVSIARIGSNTFGVLLCDLGPDLAEAQRQVRSVIDRVLDLLVDIVDLGSGVTVGTGACLGYVIWAPEDADLGSWLDARDYIVTNDANEIVKCSEIARKRSRRMNGQRRVQQFEQRMLDAVHERMMLVSELRSAIGESDLQLFAQPIVDRDRRVIGYEGLIRWQHGCHGLVPPDTFIPLAEQTGLIVEIGDFVLEEACRVLAGWAQREATRDWTFSINLSERELRVPDFVERVLGTAEKHGVPEGRLKLELTESVLHRDIDRTVRVLQTLREAGVMSSLDDFGTGYSSLSYLRQLPVQQLKIDRSFVSSIVDDAQAAAVTETIVQLGRIFDLQVVGEGVESEAQFQKLCELGVDAFQGYLFGRPERVTAG
ncbi:putative bifunctional diguanylate cyclase/phosphodiesterase [Leucobacter sp. USHLN153]|uniref:putative bifunctional diguanylate cyclase/phosphodiesterase n=1 Tax=Leucobacter sp. USHLN153 TaxID=3081268 RepID=UPI0030192F2E